MKTMHEAEKELGGKCCSRSTCIFYFLMFSLSTCGMCCSKVVVLALRAGNIVLLFVFFMDGLSWFWWEWGAAGCFRCEGNKLHDRSTL